MVDIVTPEPRPYRLRNKIQHYAWGTRGGGAFIPELLGLDAEENRPYAELWMGAHPKAPSEALVDGAYVSLGQLIARHPREMLGREVAQAFSGRLPFLLKVLSAGEVLSIQAHPNKAQAEALNARDPEHYPDDNHKLELAVALESLEGLVGFKPLPGIVQALADYPELADFIGQDVVGRLRKARQPSAEEGKALVRLAFAALMRRSIANEEALARSIDQLAGRLSEAAGRLTETERVFLDARAQYPGADAGLFSILLMNLVRLDEGQGAFIPAGTPHAYLQGNIVECMTNSDNVVRAGLTPKFKDVETLLEILTYETGPLPILAPDPARTAFVYRTPTAEFQVVRWRMAAREERCRLTRNRPEMLLVTRGSAFIAWDCGSGRGEEVLRQGQSVLVPAMLDEYTLATEDSAELFLVTVPLS